MKRITEFKSLAPGRANGRKMGCRAYKFPADRERAIKAFARAGYNHFVCYIDTNGPVALAYGICDWTDVPFILR